MSEKKDNTLNYIKALIPIVLALIGSQGYQFLSSDEHIKEVTRVELDNVLIEKLHYKVDSIAKSMVSKEAAKSSLTNAVSDIKQLNGVAANIYLKDVFKVADEAIMNHQEWSENQLPFIKSSMNKRYLCPVQDIETGDILMQGLEGDYRVRFGRPTGMSLGGKRLDIDIPFYNDVDNRATPLKYLKKPIYK